MDKELTVEQVILLIKSCHKHDVLSLDYYGLKLRMAEPEQPAMTPRPQARGLAKKASQIAEDSELQMQFDIAREEISTMHVEDPAGYEEKLIRGEIEDQNH